MEVKKAQQLVNVAGEQLPPGPTMKPTKKGVEELQKEAIKIMNRDANISPEEAIAKVSEKKVKELSNQFIRLAKKQKKKRERLERASGEESKKKKKKSKKKKDLED